MYVRVGTVFIRCNMSPVPLDCHSFRFTRHLSGRQTTHYDLLQINPDASSKDIKEAYFKLSKELHPDRNPGPQSHDKFVKLNEAFTTLRSADTRRQYDLSIGKYRATPHGSKRPDNYSQGFESGFNTGDQTGHADWRSNNPQSGQREHSQRKQSFSGEAAAPGGEQGDKVDFTINLPFGSFLLVCFVLIILIRELRYTQYAAVRRRPVAAAADVEHQICLVSQLQIGNMKFFEIYSNCRPIRIGQSKAAEPESIQPTVPLDCPKTAEVVGPKVKTS